VPWVSLCIGCDERFGELLRQEVAHTVNDPQAVEDEIRHLIAVLGVEPERRVTMNFRKVVPCFLCYAFFVRIPAFACGKE
jgi:hypothetical protein